MSPAIHPVAEPSTFTIPTVNKIPKETEFNHAYEVAVALELEYKNIKFSVKPNLVGDLILPPQDHNTAKILSEVTNLNGKTVKIIPLDPEEKTTRMVLLRYPLELPVEVIIKHPKVTKAERFVPSQDKAQTKQVLVDIKETVPEEVDLGNWGTYRLRPFVPEPLRCYKCQEFGHHQSRGHKKPQLKGCIADKAQNTPVLVENTILPGTLQPPQATTQLNTPQPANLQAAFTEEQRKQMITIMIQVPKKQPPFLRNLTSEESDSTMNAESKSQHQRRGDIERIAPSLSSQDNTVECTGPSNKRILCHSSQRS
ncbi:putative RNA-directed DNA polymerase from mobile element jockey-like 78 [Homarus americanus]|uniref:Putative RNA-directed DNA polymerase from mobile element jockey-like 78 n=1 Tax=Homarus americanus TaxID=6706 RepID=A0A8J5JJH4_HOMAM|nr:putative RNA-directed DNA polymerase from mobile element jockey-like 78 [Homarus americanus]